MILQKKKQLKIPVDTEEKSLNDNSPKNQEEESQQSSDMDVSNMSEYGFRVEKVVILNNQFEGDQLIPLVDDILSEDEENQHLDLLSQEEQIMNEREKAVHNYKIINEMLNKVQKDKTIIEKKLKSVKENSYEAAIGWNKDEKLHKEANLAILEGERDIIVLKKKKLERIRRDILNVKNLQDQVDPEVFLQIKTIDFKKGELEPIKDFFAAIDLIINKNSLIGFKWEKFCERVFKNKDTVDAFMYKLKYFPFNELTDYYYTLCKKFGEEDKEFLALFEQKGNRKIPYEIFIVKSFIEWMKIMRYGYELNLELIESIKKTNLEQQDVDKLQLITDILDERLKYQSQQSIILEEQNQKISNLLNKLLKLKNSFVQQQKLSNI